MEGVPQEPKLSYYGPINLPFVYIINLMNTIKKIEEGELAHRKGRMDCFTNDTTYEVAQRLTGLREGELFYPMKTYPPHVDRDGATYTVPLSEACELIIEQESIPITPFGLYEFDSTRAHNTIGPFLMMKKA